MAKPEIVDATVLTRAGARITPTSLIIEQEDVSYEALEDLCSFLGGLEQGCKWWIGDALLQVEMRYGDKVTQAADATGLSPQTIVNRMSICSRIPRSKRKQGLVFSTHAAVAYVEPGRRDELLGLAASEGWTRARIVAAKKGEDSLPPPVQCSCPTCGHLHAPPGS